MNMDEENKIVKIISTINNMLNKGIIIKPGIDEYELTVIEEKYKNSF